jgi:ribose transport system ATP-binding protein
VRLDRVGRVTIHDRRGVQPDRRRERRILSAKPGRAIATQPPLLRATGISRQFGAIHALREVDFQLRGGEVMALLGENGAGKSTLVKILAGLVRPDAGSIEIEGQEVDLHSPARSRASGIAVVQQELSLVPTLSAAENLAIGGGHVSGLWTRRRLRREAKPFLELVGLGSVDPTTPVESLSVAERQRVEIARLLARQAQILILDEPTAALADAEIERVMQLVRSLAAEGRAVVYVTHRLGEVFQIADRVTVLRNGESQPPVPVAELTFDTLVTRILGRPLEAMFPERATSVGTPVLELTGVLADGLLEPISLAVGAGEILGLAGQLGSGAARLVRAVAGVQAVKSGQVSVGGRPVATYPIRRSIRAGIAYCSDDRKRDGLFPIRTVTENLTTPALATVAPHGVVVRRREKRLAQELAGFFQIDRRRLDHRAATLSGGNQQKVALGKWLGVRPRVLLVEEPTLGVDVGARAEIYAHLRKLAEDGLAVMFASSDFAEVLGLADTVATFYRGRLVRIAPAEALSAAEVLRDVTHAARAEASSAG